MLQFVNQEAEGKLRYHYIIHEIVNVYFIYGTILNSLKVDVKKETLFNLRLCLDIVRADVG